MRKYKTSKRGLTFSITPDEQYYPGSHYVYEVRRNCIIIRPSEEGMTVSRKKCGVKEKALFDIRQKDVRRAVSTSDYLEMEVKEDRIVVRCVREIRNRIISLEEVMKEFCISKATLSIAAGMEGQITFDEYLASITEPEEKNKSYRHKYTDDVYQTMKCLYEPLHQPINPKDCDHEFVTMEEVMEAVDEMDETDFFEHLCELHGIPCSMVEYLYETAYGSSERKKKSHYILQRRI